MHIVSSRTNRFYSLLLVLMTSISAIAQSPSKNYVQTKTFLDDTGATFQRHIDYYDELGVVAETVDVGGNTSQTPVGNHRDWFLIPGGMGPGIVIILLNIEYKRSRGLCPFLY